MWLSERITACNRNNRQKLKIKEVRQSEEAADRQTYPEDVCPVVLPGLVQSGLLCWAELWWAAHNAPLSSSELLHSSTTHNSSLWSQRSPSHSSRCLNTVPCWAHTLSPALVTQPGATNSQWGQRGHEDMQGVTHMKAHAHTHILNLHEDEHTPPY